MDGGRFLCSNKKEAHDARPIQNVETSRVLAAVSHLSLLKICLCECRLHYCEPSFCARAMKMHLEMSALSLLIAARCHLRVALRATARRLQLQRLIVIRRRMQNGNGCPQTHVHS